MTSYNQQTYRWVCADGFFETSRKGYKSRVWRQQSGFAYRLHTQDIIPGAPIDAKHSRDVFTMTSLSGRGVVC